MIGVESRENSLDDETKIPVWDMDQPSSLRAKLRKGASDACTA
jgi:hypothetical protein